MFTKSSSASHFSCWVHCSYAPKCSYIYIFFSTFFFPLFFFFYQLQSSETDRKADSSEKDRVDLSCNLSEIENENCSIVLLIFLYTASLQLREFYRSITSVSGQFEWAWRVREELTWLCMLLFKLIFEFHLSWYLQTMKLSLSDFFQSTGKSEWLKTADFVLIKNMWCQLDIS